MTKGSRVRCLKFTENFGIPTTSDISSLQENAILLPKSLERNPLIGRTNKKVKLHNKKSPINNTGNNLMCRNIHQKIPKQVTKMPE